jgi:serine/threonine protein kinase/ferredoxin/hemoglobin-like flavoprotein
MQLAANLDLHTIIGDDFEIVGRLGEGGMGVVYEAIQRTTGHRRALKLMHAPFAMDPRSRERFEQEARVGARIHSDHVVQVVATGIDERTHVPWLAMELLQGVDLERHLRANGWMTRANVAVVMSQVIHALAAAHDVGVVHRDVKPENVFLSSSRSVGVPFMVKVLDFGIAKLRSNVRSATLAVGTPGYMAPEQASEGDDIGPAADIWPLGLIVFRMLTGCSYWLRESSLPQLWREMLVDPLPRASERARELGRADALPPDFDEWFAACVERDPSLRFQHARAAGNALSGVLGVAGVLDSADSSVPARSRTPNERNVGTLVSGLVDALHRDEPPTLATTNPAMHRVVFREEGERVVALAGEGDSLLEVSLTAGIPHYHACGGRARCSTCRVVVLEGRESLGPRTPAEQAVADRSRWPATTRLACQAKVHGPCTVRRLVIDPSAASVVDIRRTADLADTKAQSATVLVVRFEDIDDVLADGFPDDAIHVLERCLAPLGELLADNGGRLVGFEGSNAIALFEDSHEGVRRALRVALRAVARIRRLNPLLLKHFGVQVGTAAGLGRGIVVEGVAGSATPQDKVLLGAGIRDARRSCDLATRGRVLAPAAMLPERDVQTTEGPEGLRVVLDFSKSDVVFLVQTSFDRLEGRAPAFAEAFYDRLFELHPDAITMFEHTDMVRQRRMLMDTLALAVRGLDDFDKIAGAVRDLGRRHVDYGVSLRDYKFVGRALIETLAEFLGDAFTPEAELAWREVYSALVRAMTE